MLFQRRTNRGLGSFGKRHHEPAVRKEGKGNVKVARRRGQGFERLCEVFAFTAAAATAAQDLVHHAEVKPKAVVGAHDTAFIATAPQQVSRHGRDVICGHVRLEQQQ